MKSHYWSIVPGENPPFSAYSEAAYAARNEILVEVGSSFGRGTCFMMEELKFNKSNAKFYAIDVWGQFVEPVHGEGRVGDTPWGEPFFQWYNRMGGPGCYFDSFSFYVKNSPAASYLYDYAQFPSACGCEFDNESVSFLHLALSKKPENIKRDLESWWPAIKNGGQVVVSATEAHDALCQFVGKNNVSEIGFGQWSVRK